ncbi:site-specific integrase [Ligilactobacillus salivarius]|uniref:Phage integrase n=1 Tax=Ligilactobacillus salivarius SMXD51 TaxID=1108963 RepID=H7G1E2_9LACO|nr:site-specific integrase [Ligilactobacillus salivarius]EIA31969.1 phage integrase [Ligilactobacillus salivarius SMXD51]
MFNKLLKTNPGNYVILSIYTKKILQYAVTLKLIPENPMNNVIKPRQKKIYRDDNYYTKEKFHVYVLFRLLAYSGMRIGELLALKVSDIDFNTLQISITKTISSNADSRFELHKPKTSTGNRIISVDSDTINLISTLVKDKKMDDFIFRFYGCSKPYSPRTIALWKNKIIKKANLREISLHGFRHTYTSLLFESGVNIKEIQKQLGHSKVEMTLNVYTHLNRNNNNDIGSKFDNYLNN